MKKADIAESGFAPLYSGGTWLVASNGYKLGVNDKDSLSVMGRHMSTNEAFILLAGTAILLTAEKDDTIGKITAELMVPEKLYIVEKGEWHVAIFDVGASVLIIEDSHSPAEANMTSSMTAEQIQYGKQLLSDLY